MKIVRAIRQGRIVPNKPAATKPQFYALWSSADSERAPHAMHMPAPAPRLPDDSESYNPPEEHLLEDDERAAYLALEKSDRKRDFIPAKHSSLRTVPAYKDLVQERFERCLDLYLAPRMRKTRLNIDPESLVPKLPAPKELRPFPTTRSITYAHPGGARVRCVAVDPTGMWVVSGAEDGVVRVWELSNGRLAWKMEVGKGPVHAVEWCPDKEIGLFAAVLCVSTWPLLIFPQRLLTSCAVLSFSKREQGRPGFASAVAQPGPRPADDDTRAQGGHRRLDFGPSQGWRRPVGAWLRARAISRRPRLDRRPRHAQAGHLAQERRLLLDRRHRRSVLLFVRLDLRGPQLTRASVIQARTSRSSSTSSPSTRPSLPSARRRVSSKRSPSTRPNRTSSSSFVHRSPPASRRCFD